MKRLLVLFALLSNVIDASAQCNAFFPIRENVTFFYDHFDKKDKLVLTTTQKLINVSGSGDNMKGTMVQELIDAKKKEPVGTYESDWSCEGGTVRFNMNNIAFSDPAMAASGMTMDVSGDKMDLPTSLSVGQTLKDVSYQIKMNVNGVTMMNRTFNVTDRKVESQEDVTTPAGTFKCYKVTFNTTSRGGMGGGTTKSVIWYAENAGMVKSETWSENGKLLGRQVLTKIQGA